MIEFPNFKNVSAVNPPVNGWQVIPNKKDDKAWSAAKSTGADVLQISPDAALKSKLSSFSSVLAKEMSAISTERIARLKQEYSGDRCPLSGADLAKAIIAGANAAYNGYE
jgi:hypothetical protein